MKVTLYMAISLNGIIAREDGKEDFISMENWSTFVFLAKQRGCFIWGRKTYENVKTWDKKFIESVNGLKKIIVSQSQSVLLEDGFVYASSPKDAVKQLEEEGYKEVLLVGGSTNNAAFAKEKLINEIIFNIQPAIIGKGITVFKPEDFDLQLTFKKMENISDGLIQLNYDVLYE